VHFWCVATVRCLRVPKGKSCARKVPWPEIFWVHKVLHRCDGRFQRFASGASCVYRRPRILLIACLVSMTLSEGGRSVHIFQREKMYDRIHLLPSEKKEKPSAYGRRVAQSVCVFFMPTVFHELIHSLNHG
jgi:hypothetical protein